MERLIQSEGFALWIVLGIVFFIVIIWNVILQFRFTKLNHKFQRILGDTGVDDLPDVMEQLHQIIEKLKINQSDHAKQLTQIQAKLARMKGNIGVIRYNAFANTGSDLSFSIAIVDEAKDGVVISGIHNRDNMYMYAKPLENGNSTYSLSTEEKEAIDLALPSQ